MAAMAFLCILGGSLEIYDPVLPKHTGAVLRAIEEKTEIPVTEWAQALTGTREVLLAGPGLARNEFRDWCTNHHKAMASVIVDSVATDHPSDAQLVAMARQYFKKFDAMTADPTRV